MDLKPLNEGIKCIFNDLISQIIFNYSYFKILPSLEEYEYERLVNIQTKNKDKFYLKIILMKLNYEFDINDKQKHQSIIISFDSPNGRDLCKNILFIFINKITTINNIFDYSIFIKIPILQNIFDKCNLTLSKFIEILNTSKILNGPNDSIIDSIIKKETKIDFNNLINKINYISKNFIDSLPKINEIKEINKKELIIKESEIIKEIEKTDLKYFKTNFNSKTFIYEFKSTLIELNIEYPKINNENIIFKGNEMYEKLLLFSKKCFNEKINENEIIEIINFSKDFDQNLIKRINPLTFLRNKKSVNYELDI